MVSPSRPDASAATSGRISPAQAQSIAREAYVFGLPLVYIATSADVMTNVPKPEAGRAPWNQFVHFREFPDASNRTVVLWNVDTLYSLANLDLGPEPIVLSIPDMGSRWWLMQLLDAWNDVPAALGTRTVGGHGGNFAIVGPTWKGTLPEGLVEVRSDTQLTAIGGRTYTAGEADYANVHALQDRYRLTPLSKWDTDYRPPASVPVKKGVDVRTPIPQQVFALSPEAYFGRLCELLVANPARPADAPVLARMAKLGISPGAKFRASALDAATRDAIERGVRAAQDDIRAQQSQMGQMVNGWQISRDSVGRYGTKYAYRAAWTFFAVGANLVEDAIYPIALTDGDGRALTGADRYVLRFPKGETPPVDAFWSLTLYDADGYLISNPLGRSSRGDRDPLKTDPDGSVTLYLQKDSPGPGKEDNWLPAPEGPFKLALRLYRPRSEVIDGTWQPPPVQRAR